MTTAATPAPIAMQEISAEAASVRACCSLATMLRWLKAGKVKSRLTPVTRRRLIDAADLDRFLATGEPAAESEE